MTPTFPQYTSKSPVARNDWGTLAETHPQQSPLGAVGVGKRSSQWGTPVRNPGKIPPVRPAP